MAYLVFASMLMAIAVVGLFIPRVPAAVAAYATMLLLYAGGLAPFGTDTLVSWGICTALAVMLQYLLPPQVTQARTVNAYVCAGALVGAMLGILLNSEAAIILASLAGAFLGLFAYARTAAGRRAMTFPSRRFFNLLLAKALPAVVTLTVAALCFTALLTPTVL